MKYYLSPPATGPLARIIASVLALCALAAVVVFGLIAFAILFTLVLIVVVVAWVRVLLLKRGLLRGQARAEPPGEEARRQASVIDAEYEVISRRRD